MIRIAFLMFLCLARVAYAQGQPTAPGFNIEAFAAVQTEAIEFMVPRTVDPVTAEQLAAWGLSGLTTIDPALTAYVRDTNLELLQRGRPLITVTASSPTPASWAQAAARIVAAAYAASPAVRQIGQPAVTKVLFDEMLAHIDPYSRYLPPIEALGDRDRRVGRAGIGVTLVQHGPLGHRAGRWSSAAQVRWRGSAQAM